LAAAPHDREVRRCASEARINVVKLLRAHGGCLGAGRR
jgi:hypothetical protein